MLKEEISLNQFFYYLDGLEIHIDTNTDYIEKLTGKRIHLDSIEDYGDELIYVDSELGDTFTIYVKLPLKSTLNIIFED